MSTYVQGESRAWFAGRRAGVAGRRCRWSRGDAAARASSQRSQVLDLPPRRTLHYAGHRPAAGWSPTATPLLCSQSGPRARASVPTTTGEGFYSPPRSSVAGAPAARRCPAAPTMDAPFVLIVSAPPVRSSSTTQLRACARPRMCCRRPRSRSDQRAPPAVARSLSGRLS